VTANCRSAGARGPRKNGCKIVPVFSLLRIEKVFGASRAARSRQGRASGKARCHGSGHESAREGPRPTPSAQDRIDSALRSRPSHRPPCWRGGDGPGRTQGISRQGRPLLIPCAKKGLKAEPRREFRRVAPRKAHALRAVACVRSSFVLLLRKAPQPQEPRGGCLS